MSEFVDAWELIPVDKLKESAAEGVLVHDEESPEWVVCSGLLLAIEKVSALRAEIAELRQQLSAQQSAEPVASLRRDSLIMANARRLIKKTKSMSNAALYMELFGKGFTTAQLRCAELGLERHPYR